MGIETSPSRLDKVTYVRRDGDFETRLQIAVSPEDDVEVRRLSITNHGQRPREIEVTSYAEIVLARPEDDLAHPAFGKLFIETEHAAQNAGLLFSRRARARHEEDQRLGLPRPGRRRPAGRGRRVGNGSRAASSSAGGRSTTSPIALRRPARCRGTTGAVLDPVAALRERVRLPPGAFVRVTFATGIATDRTTALALVRKYRDGSAAARAFSMAFTHAQVTLQHLGLTDDHAMLAARIASRVFGADATCSQSADAGATTWLGPAEPVGTRHLRRSADRAGARRRDQRDQPRAATPPCTGVLARQGSARRRRGAQRASSGRLSRRGAAAQLGGARLQEPRWSGVEGQARRDIPGAFATG